MRNVENEINDALRGGYFNIFWHALPGREIRQWQMRLQRRAQDGAKGQRLRLLDELDMLNHEFDFVLVDTGAGISANVMYFIRA